MNKVQRIRKAILAPLKWHHYQHTFLQLIYWSQTHFNLSHTSPFLWFSSDFWVNASLCKYIIVKFAIKKQKSSPSPIGGDLKDYKLLTAKNHSVNWTRVSSALVVAFVCLAGWFAGFFVSPFCPQQQSSCVLVTENLSWHYESSFSHYSADIKLNSILAQAGGKQAWVASESQDADALKQSIS